MGFMELRMELEGLREMFDLLEGMADLEDEDAYWVGSIVEYASAVELGTPEQEAQPYLGPATIEVENKIEMENLFLEDIAEMAVFSGADNWMDRGLQEIASEVERRAKNKVPVDTGNLKASIQWGPSLRNLRNKSRLNSLAVGGRGEGTSGSLSGSNFGEASVITGFSP